MRPDSVEYYIGIYNLLRILMGPLIMEGFQLAQLNFLEAYLYYTYNKQGL